MRPPDNSCRTHVALALSMALLAGGLWAGCRAEDSGAEAIESTSDQKSSQVANGAGSAKQDSRSQAEPTPVETWTIETSTFVDAFTVPGTSRPERTIRVAAESAGRITSAPFDVGETVEEGALLTLVDSDRDRARIDRLENQLETARREYKRTKRLEKDGLATPQELDQATSRLDDVKLQLREAEIGLDNVSTRSPISGRVTRKFVEAGEYASPGAPVAELVVDDTLEVTAAIPASRVGALKEGDTLDITFPALKKTLEGVVSVIPVEVDPDTRTYPVEFTVENDQAAVRPGMRASLRVVQKVWEDAVVVPRTAVLQGFSNQEVAVVPGDAKSGQVELRRVTLGPGSGNRVVVTDGLDAGDRLVVRGHRSLTTDMPVTIVQTYPSLKDVLAAQE